MRYLITGLLFAVAILSSCHHAYQHPGTQPDIRDEEYAEVKENGFNDVLTAPLSTFSVDIDGASYANARRFIMDDQLPTKDAIRPEEFVNYFDYDYAAPEDETPLAIHMEMAECPWNSENQLVQIGLRGKYLSEEEAKGSNLVFLLDVSGSMNAPNKLPLLKNAFRLLVQQLDKQDRVAIVVYSGKAGTALKSTSGDKKEKILKVIDGLRAVGSTAGGEGIQRAYRIAEKHFIEGGNNRVILATDGDFNVGISSPEKLVELIEEKRDSGIFLTVLGFGTGNYKDYRLQELADHGNGHHAYIDNLLEAKKVLVNEVTSTLFTIAKDVKIQVEFNPTKVKSYRLIGYENRLLEDEDFEDDEKDAGEIGAGHAVTALYEVVPANSDEIAPTKSKLKYTETRIRDSAFSTADLLTVRVRYKEPHESESKEKIATLRENSRPIEEASNDLRFASAVAEFAMVLRSSEYRGNANLKDIFVLAKSSIGEDPFGYRAEFIRLVDRVRTLELLSEIE